MQALSKVNREFYQKLNTQESYYGEKETIGAQSVKNEFGIDSIRKSSDDLLSLGKYALKISESRECLSHNSAKMIMSKLQVYNNKENAG